MIIARVRGTVVGSTRSDGLTDPRYLLVELSDQYGQGQADYLVALDMVGANRSELVLVAQGSSCRWTTATEDRPVDALVVAIVEAIDQRDTLTYPSRE